jgi:hypothetical protein
VGESIQGFTGRCGDTVNIPSKSTPIGIKIWCLADFGYVFDFLWLRRGIKPYQGPQGLRKFWQEHGFAKTQSVVLELVLRMSDQGQSHVIWLDNLFTTQELLSFLRENHVGAAGTVRTGPTKREMNDYKNSKGEDVDKSGSEGYRGSAASVLGQP